MREKCGTRQRPFCPPPQAPRQLRGLAALGVMQLDDEHYELLTGQRPMSENEKRAMYHHYDYGDGAEGQGMHTLRPQGPVTPEALKAWKNRLRIERLDPAYREREREKNRERMRAYRADPKRAAAMKPPKELAREYTRRSREKKRAQGLTSQGTPMTNAERQRAYRERNPQKVRETSLEYTRRMREQWKAQGLTVRGTPQRTWRGAPAGSVERALLTKKKR